MDKKIIEASELPEGEKVYLKKDSSGWRVVEPIRDEQGKFKWKRFMLGTKRERRFMYFIIFLAIVSYLAFDEQLNNYKRVMDNPCAFCNSCQEQTNQVIRNLSIWQNQRKPIFNISSLNSST